ncbi:MAG: hypothetical protein RBS39_13670 [Phycisphaerales bacterium]|jgi:MYXO-CTERM domain-containing protein|nr:hypothetical protein [Phycisphaerales bacterium]
MMAQFSNGTSSVRASLFASAALLSLHTAGYAAVVSGTIVDRVGTFPFDASGPNPVIRAYEVGDGSNHVTINPAFGTWFPWESSLYFIGSMLDGGIDGWHDTDVALVPGITDISLITDASAYSYTNGYIPDQVLATDYTPTSAPPPDWISGTSGLVLLRNTSTGHYGAVIFRDSWDFENSTFSASYGAFSAMVELDWYFQTDGSGDFSSVPAPTSAALPLAFLVGATARRRRA